MQIRGFREIEKNQLKHALIKTQLPKRGDAGSAGYDFYSKEKVIIAPGQSHLFWTDIQSYMPEDEVLFIFVRSSIGIKKGLVLKNGTGVIDSSYTGNIGICLYNLSSEEVIIDLGERIAQGVFQKYLLADEDHCLHKERIGGFGSSNRG